MKKHCLSFYTFWLILAVNFISVSHASLITTNVTANVNGFNSGPFSGGDDISLSFFWDTDAVRDSGTSSFSNFNTAIKDITLTIGSYTLTGTDAFVSQRDNTGDDQINIRLGSRFGTDYGTVNSAPNINGYAFESIDLVFRSINQLFPTGDTTTLISAPSSDLYIDSLTVFFDDNDNNTFDDDVINPHNKSFTMSVATVPAPSTLALMFIGFALIQRKRIKIKK